jgi:hypothetical protein
MLSYSKTAMERAVKVQEVISRAEAKRSRDGRQQKKWRARRGCGKDAEWKSQKSDFPTSLGNPANPAGFPLSHSPGGYGRLTKIEHSLFYEKGTFLMS